MECDPHRKSELSHREQNSQKYLTNRCGVRTDDANCFVKQSGVGKKFHLAAEKNIEHDICQAEADNFAECDEKDRIFFPDAS